MAPRRKFYVVWAGHSPGVYDSWEECKLQTANFPGARYKSFDTQEEAVMAYRGNPADYLNIFKAMGQRTKPVVNYAAIPEIVPGAIAVDAACSRNPGPVEYRGVDIASGQQLFHVGPMEGGSNNMGEFLAIVHALAMLTKAGRGDITIYSDSRTAMAWVRNRRAKTTIAPTAENARIRQLVSRAEQWLATHTYTNPILKWDTDRWGEIPADFGRK
ncbi:MAG: ribonuclease H family protein [Firmicutes bacterium]|nr:ribonuclease H family protein [Bacillota bacterium]MCM1400568.1 ribonuclease H family protein [Bacteroides sp.]MCM1476472.1 ribonuclease H family protein [Bacteroides sp.]